MPRIAQSIKLGNLLIFQITEQISTDSLQAKAAFQWTFRCVHINYSNNFDLPVLVLGASNLVEELEQLELIVVPRKSVGAVDNCMGCLSG